MKKLGLEKSSNKMRLGDEMGKKLELLSSRQIIDLSFDTGHHWFGVVCLSSFTSTHFQAGKVDLAGLQRGVLRFGLPTYWEGRFAPMVVQ